MIAALRRNWLLVFTTISIAAVTVAAVLAARSGNEQEARAGACPQGQQRVKAERDREGEKAKGEAGDYESHFAGKCAPVSHPESAKDLAKFTEYASTRQGADTQAQFSKAV